MLVAGDAFFTVECLKILFGILMFSNCMDIANPSPLRDLLRDERRPIRAVMSYEALDKYLECHSPEQP